jgi:xanthine dehydrogenase YagS FAD-binding subunit
LLDLMKEGIVIPARLINLKLIPELGIYENRPFGELALGALTTLAKIAAAPEIQERYGALAEAAAHAATPQIRNAATIGGDLLQKPRCWYFRNEYFHREDVTNGDPARIGENSAPAAPPRGDRRGLTAACLTLARLPYHSIFDNGTTAMVHASTPATALVAYDAKIELVGAGATKRVVPVREFFLPPTLKSGRGTVIEPGEVLTQVILPALPEGTKAAYHKQTERESYDWPICDVAVVLQIRDRTIRSASITMVGSHPYHGGRRRVNASWLAKP